MAWHHDAMSTDTKTSKIKKRPTDTNELANLIGRMATGEAPIEPPPEEKPKHEKNAAAVALGKLGGLKGGKKRAESMTAEERSEAAKKAARSRWGDKK